MSVHGDIIDATKNLRAASFERAYVDKGYRDHPTTNLRRVFISGQKRGVFGTIQCELRRRATIGHLKSDGHRARCYLKG
jgi:IS5 family transposase